MLPSTMKNSSYLFSLIVFKIRTLTCFLELNGIQCCDNMGHRQSNNEMQKMLASAAENAMLRMQRAHVALNG